MSEKKLSETFNRIMAMKTSADHSLFNAPDGEPQGSLETVLDEYDSKAQKGRVYATSQIANSADDLKAKRAEMKNLRTKQTHTRIIAQHIAFKM